LTGKTWWGSHVLLPGLVIGAVAALIGAALGSGVGHALATTAGRRSRAPSPNRIVRWGAPAGAAVLIASLVSAAGYGQLVGQGQTVQATYSSRGNHVRLAVSGASAGDWVSILGPRRPLGVFERRLRPGTEYGVRL